MAKRKRSRFADAVGHDAKTKQASRGQFSYLRLPQDMSMFKVEKIAEDGRVNFDILPYIVTDSKHPDRDDDVGKAQVGKEWYKRPFWVHRGIGSQNEMIICPTSVRKKCPICIYRAKRTKEDAEKEEIAAMRTSLRNLYVVMPLDMKDYKEEPHILDISDFCFQDLLSDELKEKDKYWTFAELEGGYTISARFDMEKFAGNDFAKASRIDFENRKGDYDETIIEIIPPLDDILKVLPFTQLEEKFMELEDEPGPEEDDNDKLGPEEDAGSEPLAEEEEDKPKSYRKPKNAETEAEPESEEPGEEPEPEKEKPKPKRQTKKEEDSGGEENPCPHGHEYGMDAETKKDCDNCDVWEECLEVKTKNEA